MREKLILGIVLLFASAAAAWAHGDIHQQIAEVTRLLEEDGENAELYYKRGRLHLEHESWDEALADFEQARQIRPDLSELDYHMGRTLFGAGRTAEADKVLAAYLERLRQGEDVRGARVRAHFLHGRVLSALERPAAAAAAFERTVEAAETPLPDQYLEWAMALRATGGLGLVEAVAVLDRGMARLGPLVTLALPAIDLELERGEVGRALERLDRVIAKTPRSVSHLHRRGQILRDAGCVVEARESFEKALGVLEEVPGHRRRTRAFSELEAAVRADLADLPSESRTCPIR